MLCVNVTPAENAPVYLRNFQQANIPQFSNVILLLSAVLSLEDCLKTELIHRDFA